MLKKSTQVVIALACTLLSASSLAIADAADTPTAQARPVRDKWALVIGIADFADPQNQLKYSAKDAQDFANYLTKEAGFAPDHVKVLLNKDATKRRILSELGDRWLPRVANPDDLVVLFISTHGSGAELDVGGQNYLLATDTDVNDLYTTGISMQNLARDIKERVHSDRMIIFLDACHSGATGVTGGGAKGLVRSGVDVQDFSTGSGQLVIASCKDNQASWESKNVPNGVFTATLLDTLRSKGGSGSIANVFASLKDGVQNTVLRERGKLQTPVMSSQGQGGDIVIAAEPTARHPGLEETPVIASATTAKVSRVDTKEVGATQPSQPATGETKVVATVPVTQVTAPVTLPTTPISKPVIRTKPAPPAVTVSTPVASGAVNPRSLVVPGASVGRLSLSMTRSDVQSILGKPTVTVGDTATYWSGDKRFFLSVEYVGDKVAQIAFTSPVFRTVEGISVGNFSSARGRFKAVAASAQATAHALSSGGFAVVVPRNASNAPVGVVYAGELAASSLNWLPQGVGLDAEVIKAESAPPKLQLAKPAVVTTGGAKPPAPVVSTTLIVPGISIAKVRLGMSKADILKLLGKPAEEPRPGVLIYRAGTGARRYILAIRVDENGLADVAFTSPAFVTAGSLNVGNFQKCLSDFDSPITDSSGSAKIYTLRGGGLSMVTGAGRPSFGWLHRTGESTNDVTWMPKQ